MKRRALIAGTSVMILLVILFFALQVTGRKQTRSQTSLVSQTSKFHCQSKAASSVSRSSVSSASASTQTSQSSSNRVNSPDQALQALKAALNNPTLTYDYLAYEDGIYELSVAAPNSLDNLNQTGDYLVYTNGQVRAEKQVPQDAAKFDKYKKVSPSAPTGQPDRTIRIHNAQEAANRQRELLQSQGLDKGDFVYQGSADANGSYQVIVTSQSLKAAGGSGTVGIYIVDPNGQSRLRN